MPLTSTVVMTGVAFGVLTCDHIFSFPRELACWRSSHGRFGVSSGFLSFVLLRYSGLLAMTSSLLFVVMKTNHCEALIIANQIGTLLTVASAGCIFIMSTRIKWDGNRFMAGLMGTLYAAMVACSCVTAVQFHPAINRESAESECQLQPLSPLTALGYGASVIFDMAILISMLLKKASAVSYPPGSSIKARVAYVTVATASNFFFLTIHALGSKLENVKAAAQPFATVITVVIGARLFMMQDPLESQHSGLPFYRRNTPGRPQSLNPLSILYVGRQSPTILVTPPTAGNEGNLKSYPVNISGATQRPDTPFSSYDYYDSDSEEKPAKNISKDTKTAYITRETVVIID